MRLKRIKSTTYVDFLTRTPLIRDMLSWNFETTKSPAVANYARLAIKEQSIVAVTLTTFPTPSTAFSNCSAFQTDFFAAEPLASEPPSVSEARVKYTCSRNTQADCERFFKVFPKHPNRGIRRPFSWLCERLRFRDYVQPRNNEFGPAFRFQNAKRRE